MNVEKIGHTNFAINLSEAATRATDEAVQLNNQGLALSSRGDFVGAERLYKRALQLKVETYGEKSIQAALSFNALGEAQYQLGKYDDAEENLRKAVEVRSHEGPVFDAAVSRENLARVFEAKEQFFEAKKMRDRGKPDKLACGNETCPGQTFSVRQMKQCSRCHCIYYCSVNCQSVDWKTRHKKFCKKTDF